MKFSREVIVTAYRPNGKGLRTLVYRSQFSSDCPGISGLVKAWKDVGCEVFVNSIPQQTRG
jgi:hypothetical protein